MTTRSKIDDLPNQNREEIPRPAFDDEDMAVFNFSAQAQAKVHSKRKRKEVAIMYGGGDSEGEGPSLFILPKPADGPKPTEDCSQKPLDDWKHDAEYVQRALETFTPPPFESSGSATIALQKELMLTLKEQKNAKSLKDLGWYVPTELLGDNLYQWIVEMHSFDPDLPIAKDMEKK